MTSAFGNYYTHRQALVKILLMLLGNYCAKIATKKRKHNTNSTEMSVDLVVCVLAVLSLSGAEKGRGQLMRHTNVQVEDGILGNTAQFPPDGLSTAPAAAARHLRCQNAR